jgi:hypothetical protein
VLAAPRMLGRYRLCMELAQGGMGTVYLARSEGPGGFEKLVALKSIHPHMAKDQKFVAMFLDEARIAARIHHPNVCSVIDFGEAGGTYFLTMPYLMGESLGTVVRALRKSSDAELRQKGMYIFARLIADACEGLHAAHELRDERGEALNVVHRDVSPQNLFVGLDGHLAVLDFGVASARHRLYSTATGEVKGKFAYICPEQLESRSIDRRADVWSLGVVLWECIALERLFSRDDMGSTVRAVISEAIPSLRDKRPDAPIGLEEIVFKALARDQERRYPTAREMGRDLVAFLGESSRAIGAADVSEWLERLMPDARVRAQQRVEQASLDGALDSLVAPGDGEAKTQTEASSAVVAAPKRRNWGAWIGVIGLAAFAATVSAALIYVLLRDDGREAIASAPQPIEERPRERAPDPTPTRQTAIEAQQPTPEAPPPIVEEPTEEAQPEEPTEEPSANEETEEQPARDHDRRPRGRGTLTVATPGGWALVFVGSRRLGEAPGTFELPAGPVSLSIQPFGRGDRVRRRVVIPADRTVRVSIPVQ